ASLTFVLGNDAIKDREVFFRDSLALTHRRRSLHPFADGSKTKYDVLYRLEDQISEDISFDKVTLHDLPGIFRGHLSVNDLALLVNHRHHGLIFTITTAAGLRYLHVADTPS